MKTITNALKQYRFFVRGLNIDNDLIKSVDLSQNNVETSIIEIKFHQQEFVKNLPHLLDDLQNQNEIDFEIDLLDWENKPVATLGFPNCSIVFLNLGKFDFMKGDSVEFGILLECKSEIAIAVK